MPQTALIRQLPRLTRLGLLSPMNGYVRPIELQLRDAKRIREARIHPLNLLVAQRTPSSRLLPCGPSRLRPTVSTTGARLRHCLPLSLRWRRSTPPHSRPISPLSSRRRNLHPLGERWYRDTRPVWLQASHDRSNL